MTGRGQRTAKKLIPQLADTSFSNRLKELRTPTLYHRRARGDMTECYICMEYTEWLEICWTGIQTPWQEVTATSWGNQLSLTACWNFFFLRWKELSTPRICCPCQWSLLYHRNLSRPDWTGPDSNVPTGPCQWFHNSNYTRANHTPMQCENTVQRDHFLWWAK